MPASVPIAPVPSSVEAFLGEEPVAGKGCRASREAEQPPECPPDASSDRFPASWAFILSHSTLSGKRKLFGVGPLGEEVARGPAKRPREGLEDVDA